VPRGQRDRSLRPYSLFSRPEPLLFLPSSPSVLLTRLSGPQFQTHYFFFFLNVSLQMANKLGNLRKKQQQELLDARVCRCGPVGLWVCGSLILTRLTTGYRRSWQNEELVGGWVCCVSPILPAETKNWLSCFPCGPCCIKGNSSQNFFNIQNMTLP
jgi:hypothetical protein